MTINANGGLVGGNVVLSRAGGATANLSGITGAATTYTIQNVTYSVGGKLYYKGTASGAATPTTDVVTGKAFNAIQKNQGCVYVWTLDAAGNVGVAQGPLPVSPTTTGTQTNVDDSGNYTLLPQFPAIPDTLTPFAYSVVRTTSSYAGTGFLFGSANWNTAGVVATAVDLLVLPAVPQTA